MMTGRLPAGTSLLADGPVDRIVGRLVDRSPAAGDGKGASGLNVESRQIAMTELTFPRE